MTVEFFGVRGFGPMGAPRKTERPGETQKNDKTTETKGADFSATLRGASEAQAGTRPEDIERGAKVQALKQQVAEGSYQPDLQKVASSLLKFLVEEG